MTDTPKEHTMPDGRVVRLIDSQVKQTCKYCVGNMEADSRLCGQLPRCGSDSEVWMDDANFAQWIAEVRLT